MLLKVRVVCRCSRPACLRCLMGGARNPFSPTTYHLAGLAGCFSYRKKRQGSDPVTIPAFYEGQQTTASATGRRFLGRGGRGRRLRGRCRRRRGGRSWPLQHAFDARQLLRCEQTFGQQRAVRSQLLLHRRRCRRLPAPAVHPDDQPQTQQNQSQEGCERPEELPTGWRQRLLLCPHHIRPHDSPTFPCGAAPCRSCSIIAPLRAVPSKIPANSWIPTPTVRDKGRTTGLLAFLAGVLPSSRTRTRGAPCPVSLPGCFSPQWYNIASMLC
jgi:hypothetical protein